MKQKKYIITKLALAGVFLLAFFISCEDLDEGSKGAISADSYFADPLSLDAGVNGIYGILTRAIWGVDILCAYTGADDLTSRPAGGNNKWVFREGDQFALTGGNERLVGIWKEFYKTIQATNSFIESASIDNGDEETLNAALANAYFVRGLLYFRLTTIFGDIPMPLESNPNFEIEKTSMRNVMTQVTSDMRYVEKWAVNERDQIATVKDGRATKTAAKAFLAKTYMQLTGWPFNETDKWDSVKAYTTDIINAGVYSLLDDFTHNFGSAWENNKEVIWAHQFIKQAWPIGTECRWYGQFWGNWMDMYFEWNYFNDFPEGYRKFTSATDDTARSIYVDTYDHPIVMKLLYGTIEGLPEFEHVWQTSNDMPAMRYSEVLLMHAEACANTGETGEAVQSLNYVRRRAYANGATTSAEVAALGADFWKSAHPGYDFNVSDFVSPEALADTIIKERAYEFVCEVGGNRWLDLVRLERVDQANQDRDPRELPLIGNPSDKNKWFTPIPDTEIDQNPNLAD